jgi:hypothetical protein
MIAIGLLFVGMLCDCFKSRRRLEAEILILRHQLNFFGGVHRAVHYSALGRPRSVHLALSPLPSHPRCHNHRAARDCGALASEGFCRLLAMAVPFARRPAADCQRSAGPNPKSEF